MRKASSYTMPWNHYNCDEIQCRGKEAQLRNRGTRSRNSRRVPSSHLSKSCEGNLSDIYYS